MLFVLFCFCVSRQGSHITKVGFELACYVVKDDDELSVRLSLSASSTEIASMSCHTQLAQKPQADHVSMQHLLWKAYACVTSCMRLTPYGPSEVLWHAKLRMGCRFLFLDTTHKGHCLQFLGREQKPCLAPSCFCILGFQGTTKH